MLTIGLFLLALSVLIIIHELGHYLPAKIFGMRVEKFYLFFDWPAKNLELPQGEDRIRDWYSAPGRLCEDCRDGG